MKNYLFILTLLSLSFSSFSQNQIPDTQHLLFRIGTNFDFLNNSLSFNKVYGSLKYTNDKIAPIFNRSTRLYFGVDIGGSRSTSLTVLKDSFISHASFIDQLNPQTVPDSLNVIDHTIKSKQSQSFGQLSLYFNPFICYDARVSESSTTSLRFGVGLWSEMYRVSSYLKYTDTAILKRDSSRVWVNSRFVPHNFNDSTGSSNTYGYFGISLSMMLYSKDVIVKIKGVWGQIWAGNTEENNYKPTSNVYNADGTKFYLVCASITEPHSKISVEANIRGLLPNYTPVWSVYATKQFDIAKIYDAVTK